MTQTQQNRLSMNKAVHSLNEKMAAVWNQLPAFVRAQNELGQAVDGLDKVLQIQSGTSTGATIAKQTDAETAIDLVLRVARNTSAYALEAKDHNLFARLNYSKTYLLRLPDNEQVDALVEMMSQVSAKVALLADFNVTPNEVAAANAAVERAKAGLTAPREVIVEQSSATKSLPQLQAHARHALSMMDRMIHNFSDANPDYVRQYKQARIVVDAGKRHDGDGTSRGGVMG